MSVPPFPPPMPEPQAIPRHRRIQRGIGGMSIVFACLGLAAYAVGAVTAAIFAFVAAPSALKKLAATPPASFPATAAAVAPVVAPEPVVAEGGLNAGDRQQVTEGLARLRSLSPERRRQLDIVLATVGKTFLPSDDRSPDAARAAVTEHGVMFTAEAGKAGPDYFSTAAGRIELYDDRAVFYPRDGSDAVRVTATPAGPRGLNPKELDRVIDAAQAACNNGLNPSQVAALRTALSSSTQRLIQPAQAGPGREPVRSASVDRMGVATVEFEGASPAVVSIDVGGAIRPGPRAGSDRSGVSAAAAALTIAACFAGALACVYLFVAGLTMTKDARRGSAKHRRYVAMQIPLAVLTAIAVWWLMSSYAEAAASARGLTAASSQWLIPTVAAVLGLMYPVILLVALSRLRAARDADDESGQV